MANLTPIPPSVLGSEWVNEMKTEEYSSEMSKDKLLALLSEILSRREDGIAITVIAGEKDDDNG